MSRKGATACLCSYVLRSMQKFSSPTRRWDLSHRISKENAADSPPRRWDLGPLNSKCRETRTGANEHASVLYEVCMTCMSKCRRVRTNESVRESTDKENDSRMVARGGWSFEDLVHLGSRGQHVCYVPLHAINTHKHTHPVNCRQHA